MNWRRWRSGRADMGRAEAPGAPPASAIKTNHSGVRIDIPLCSSGKANKCRRRRCLPREVPVGDLLASIRVGGSRDLLLLSPSPPPPRQFVSLGRRPAAQLNRLCVQRPLVTHRPHFRRHQRRLHEKTGRIPSALWKFPHVYDHLRNSKQQESKSDEPEWLVALSCRRRRRRRQCKRQPQPPINSFQPLN